MIKVLHYILVNPENGKLVYVIPSSLHLCDEVDSLPERVPESYEDVCWSNWVIFGVTTNSVFNTLHSTKPVTLLRSSFPIEEEKVNFSSLGKAGFDAAKAGKSLGRMIKKLENDVVNGTSEMEGQPIGLLGKLNVDQTVRGLSQNMVKQWVKAFGVSEKDMVQGDGYKAEMVNIVNADGKGGYIVPKDIAPEMKKLLTEAPPVKVKMVALDKEQRYMQMQITVGKNEIEQVDYDGFIFTEIAPPILGVFQKQIKIHDGTLGAGKNITEIEATKHMDDSTREALKLGRHAKGYHETQYARYSWKVDKK